MRKLYREGMLLCACAAYDQHLYNALLEEELKLVSAMYGAKAGYPRPSRHKYGAHNDYHDYKDYGADYGHYDDYPGYNPHMVCTLESRLK